MSSARAFSRVTPAAFRSAAGVALCLFAAALWMFRSVCALPLAVMADVPVIVVSSSEAPAMPDLPGTEDPADVETEEAEGEVEMAESSADEERDDDDGAEEACSWMIAVAFGAPPPVKLLPHERSPSTQAWLRRHPRPAEAV